MDKRVSSKITKSIKDKLDLSLKQYAYSRNISLSSLKAYISGVRNNYLVFSVLVSDGIISPTHTNKKIKKGYSYELQ